MLKKLAPDYYFNKFCDITPEFLIKNGIKAIVSDIDNTLVTYDDITPTDAVLSWINNLENNGIKISFVSNNTKGRVDVFNSKLNFFAVGKAKKPFKRNVLAALVKMGVKAEEACMLGDQVFTDVFAGKGAKIRTILVDPIKDKTDAFTKAKRLLEKPILKNCKKHS